MAMLIGSITALPIIAQSNISISKTFATFSKREIQTTATMHLSRQMTSKGPEINYVIEVIGDFDISSEYTARLLAVDGTVINLNTMDCNNSLLRRSYQAEYVESLDPEALIYIELTSPDGKPTKYLIDKQGKDFKKELLNWIHWRKMEALTRAEVGPINSWDKRGQRSIVPMYLREDNGGPAIKISPKALDYVHFELEGNGRITSGNVILYSNSVLTPYTILSEFKEPSLVRFKGSNRKKLTKSPLGYISLSIEGGSYTYSVSSEWNDYFQEVFKKIVRN